MVYSENNGKPYHFLMDDLGGKTSTYFFGNIQVISWRFFTVLTPVTSLRLMDRLVEEGATIGGVKGMEMSES